MSARTGVVLAGGASSRMGTDKALVPWRGRALAVHVADALRAGGCDPVWCQGGDADALGRLGLAVRPDARPGRTGPVHAIAAALQAVTTPVAVIAACDLPGLTGGVVRDLADRTAATGSVAVAVAGGRRHLAAAWPGGAATRVADAIAGGVLAYGDLLAELGAVDVAVETAAVHNVNRPADLTDPDPGRRYPPPAMTVHEISVDELAPLLEAGARLVDVREPDEYSAARVPGGVLVPLGIVPDHVDAFRGEGPTYVICRSGARSMRACEFLVEQGVDAVNVAGGTLAWIESGRDVAAGPA